MKMNFLRGNGMFVYRTRVRLKDTDATGVLYFSEQLRLGLEAFEAFLEERGFSLRKLLESPYLMPIVHAEADYHAPLMVGDAVEITVKVAQVGTSSIRLQYAFYDPDRKAAVGKAEIVHVLVDNQSRKSVPIPTFLREILGAVAESPV
ncbi:MAG TPA: thioesterase family protein [Bacteroidota bacterium]|nr:thioesterase family protein [Bacteroidota bacterium]